MASRGGARSLHNRRLRASDAFELVLFDRLPPSEQELLRSFLDDPDFYGVLKPRRDDGSAKAVNRETALLLYSLQEAGPLPRYASRELDAKGWDHLAELVLSGVLEIEDGSRFLSGPAALDLLRPPADGSGDAYVVEGAIAGLSRCALQQVAALGLKDSRHIARWLYGYHTVPLTARWHRRLADDEAVRTFLGLDEVLQATLRRHWKASGSAESPWWSWSRHASISAAKTGGTSKSDPTFKLYVSPALDDLAAAFRVLVGALPSTRAHSFKIGNQVLGLLRPDKIVLYFKTYDDLSEAASILALALDGVRPQGVPFTSEIAADGLLSWGMDPPWTERLPWQSSQSWRTWVVDHLAQSLVESAELDGADAWRFATERLRLRGVDTDRWTPVPSLWLASGAAEGP